ncbi:hypothetical protein FOZG_09138 [Fusarium oxysporum Fo47]|uniref:Uncharacterized protein n=1 Tax=Fusarium oxysporum Fo47 TaxID=660027 RepID=W9KCK8_FUSOX|nr:hypothetical protein FOZG_09138 [Fusarium oxysporum Fo47]
MFKCYEVVPLGNLPAVILEVVDRTIRMINCEWCYGHCAATWCSGYVALLTGFGFYVKTQYSLRATTIYMPIVIIRLYLAILSHQPSLTPHIILNLITWLTYPFP